MDRDPSCDLMSYIYMSYIYVYMSHIYTYVYIYVLLYILKLQRKEHILSQR